MNSFFIITVKQSNIREYKFLFVYIRMDEIRIYILENVGLLEVFNLECRTKVFFSTFGNIVAPRYIESRNIVHLDISLSLCVFRKK